MNKFAEMHNEYLDPERHEVPSADILFSYPSYDEDEDTWRLYHVWYYSDDTFSECDTDGNHDDIDPEDVKSLESRVPALWNDYALWAIKHGKDPCGQYMVRRERTVKRNIVVHFDHWIGESEHGLSVRLVRWAKGLQKPEELPEGLQGYLCLKRVGDRWCMDGITTDTLRDEVGYLGSNYFKTRAEWKEPIPESDIRAEIRRIARKQLHI